MAESETLGFVGLGVMGEPMCANLVRKSGKTVHGFDLMQEPLQRLSELGLKPADSLKKIAAQCDVVFLSLPSGKQVEEVCMGSDGLLSQPGRLRTIVDLSTCPASLARSLEKYLQEKGISFIDAPVARMRKAAHDGTLAIMVGGDGKILEEVRPYLDCMGTDIIHCGDIGAGQVVKALNNMIVFMNVHALAEALAIGRANGVDPAMLFEAMSMGSADSFALRNPGMKALVPDEFPEQTFPTDYALKDIRLALGLAEEGGVDAHQAQATYDLLVRTSEAGYAKNYYPAMIRLIEGRDK